MLDCTVHCVLSAFKTVYTTKDFYLFLFLITFIIRRSLRPCALGLNRHKANIIFLKGFCRGGRYRSRQAERLRVGQVHKVVDEQPIGEGSSKGIGTT